MAIQPEINRFYVDIAFSLLNVKTNLNAGNTTSAKGSIEDMQRLANKWYQDNSAIYTANKLSFDTLKGKLNGAAKAVNTAWQADQDFANKKITQTVRDQAVADALTVVATVFDPISNALKNQELIPAENPKGFYRNFAWRDDPMSDENDMQNAEQPANPQLTNPDAQSAYQANPDAQSAYQANPNMQSAYQANPDAQPSYQANSYSAYVSPAPYVDPYAVSPYASYVDPYAVPYVNPYVGPFVDPYVGSFAAPYAIHHAYVVHPHPHLHHHHTMHFHHVHVGGAHDGSGGHHGKSVTCSRGEELCKDRCYKPCRLGQVRDPNTCNCR